MPVLWDPAEVVEGKPYEWNPRGRVLVIRCSNEWCRMHNVDAFSFTADLTSPRLMALEDWNRRKRKNRLTWEGRHEG